MPTGRGWLRLGHDLGERWIWLRWRVRGPRRRPPDGLTIAQAEARIRHRRFETAYVFDQAERQLFRQEGNQDGVRFAVADLPLLRDAIVVHNHAAWAGYDPGDPRWDGGSFSRTDMELAILHDFAELRVVSASWHHRMVRPNRGWPIDAVGVIDIYHETEAEIQQEWAGAVASGRMTLAEAEGGLVDEVATRVARRVGFHNAREHR